jgi:hypothetical protein
MELGNVELNDMESPPVIGVITLDERGICYEWGTREMHTEFCRGNVKEYDCSKMVG